MTVKSLLSASLLAAVASGSALADTPAVKRSVLQRHDIHASGMEGVMARVEIPVGGREGRHTHPADVFAYLISGTLVLEVEGRPTAVLKPGDSFFVEAGKAHEGINRGDSPVILVGTFAADKGKPLTTQVQ